MAIATFDKSVHFYTFNGLQNSTEEEYEADTSFEKRASYTRQDHSMNLEPTPNMTVMADIDDPYFAGVSPDMAFVDPKVHAGCIESLLDQIPMLHGENGEKESCASAAVINFGSCFY